MKWQECSAFHRAPSNTTGPTPLSGFFERINHPQAWPIVFHVAEFPTNERPWFTDRRH
jgi:hypothetical protein